MPVRKAIACATAVVTPIVVLALSASASTSADSLQCVRAFFKAAHYEVGPDNSKVTKRDVAISKWIKKSFRLQDLGLLDGSSLDRWCEFAQSSEAKKIIDKRAIVASVNMKDQPGPKKFWTGYDRAPDCDRGPNRPKLIIPRTKKLKPFDADVAAQMTFPFPASDAGRQLAAKSCKAMLGTPVSESPPPVLDVKSDGKYGPGLQQINEAKDYLTYWAYLHWLAPSPVAAGKVKDVLLRWSDAKAFSKGLRQPGDWRAMEFDALEVLPVFIVSFGEVHRSMTIEERVQVGTWLRRLVGEAEISSWSDRQDNKAYLRDYTALLWGTITNDQRLKDAAYEGFRIAIEDMRPDGSFPRDSSRGGNGLHYSNRSTGVLNAIAVVASTQGVDLYGYAKDGRSIHDAIKWIAVTSKYPDLNMRHAVACPNGSFEGTTVEEPTLDHVDPRRLGFGSTFSWIQSYASSRYAENQTVSLIGAVFPNLEFQGTIPEPTLGGYFNCYAQSLDGYVKN